MTLFKLDDLKTAIDAYYAEIDARFLDVERDYYSVLASRDEIAQAREADEEIDTIDTSVAFAKVAQDGACTAAACANACKDYSRSAYRLAALATELANATESFATELERSLVDWLLVAYQKRKNNLPVIVNRSV